MSIVAIGGSDAGISAALRARELDPDARRHGRARRRATRTSRSAASRTTSPATSRDWRNLAHRTVADLEATGMTLRLDTLARTHRRRRPSRSLSPPTAASRRSTTTRWSSAPARCRSARRSPASTASAPSDGVHLLHSMGDTFALMRTLEQPARQAGGDRRRRLHRPGDGRGAHRPRPRRDPARAAPRGAADRRPRARRARPRRARTPRRRRVVQHTRRRDRARARRLCGTARGPAPPAGRRAAALSSRRRARRRSAFAPTASSPRRPAPSSASRERSSSTAQMRTNLPDVFAAGDCVVTHHRLLGTTYLPLGTTAHKQGTDRRRERPRRHTASFAGSLGTQVVKVFDLVAARTGLRDHEATAGGLRSAHCQPRRPTTTRPTTPAATRSRCATPATAAPAASSASSSSAASAPRSPSASTSPRRRSSTR